MSNKLTGLERSLGAVLALLYVLGRRAMLNINDPKKLDFKDADKYLTKSGVLAVAARNDLTDESKQIMEKVLTDTKNNEPETARILSADPTFVQSINNIFTSKFLQFLRPKTPEVKEENQPEKKQKRGLIRVKRTPPTIDSEEKQPEQVEPVPIPETTAQRAERKRQEEEERKREEEEKIDQSYLTMPSGFNVFEGIPTGEQKEKARKELRKEAKSSAKVPTLARRAADALGRTAELLGELASGQQTLISGQGELLQEIKNRMATIQKTPELETIESKIRARLSGDVEQEYEGISLDANSINQITSTIPERFRDLLGPAVQGLVGSDLKLNQVISGLVGLAVSVGSGSSVIGLGTKSIIDRVFKAFNINMNDIITSPDAPADAQADAQADALVVVPADAPADAKADETPSTFEQRFNQLLRLARIPITGARRPTPEELRTGAIVGGATGALVGGLSSGSLMTGAGSMMAGGLIGTPVTSLTSGQMQRLAESLASRFPNITPERKEQIRMIVQALPPALVASYMTFNPENEEPIGTDIITGAGVTERKLTVPTDIIARTVAQETQAQGSNKIWQPKSISPTTDILNETNQEKYADDLEFIAFNYIAPGSEGAQGTIDTNPLKRSQATADTIRYTDAGVMIPYLLWNQINDASTMTPNRLQKMALGVELPPMEFMEQDNETTFENVATVQYPNNEPMAIEFLSPYADFSNVDNFWAMNPDNMLFTINT